MLRRLFASVMLLCFLTGCSMPAAGSRPVIYEATFLSLFDTVTTVKGTAADKESFDLLVGEIYADLQQYHRIFDRYNDYEGINNIKTINDCAGNLPVAVEPELIAFLKDCVYYYELTSGRTNIAIGSVLDLWHEARENALMDPFNACIPNEDLLHTAAQHMDIEKLVIDEENSTVFLADPDMRLDVGAVAKGWAVQRIAEKLPSGILLSVGGNICATGPKYEGEAWAVGIRDPQGSADNYLHALYVDEASVVTSGDYQRSYVVNGKLYHHIIDPDTQRPSDFWRAVTVVGEDSGLADALSTALFLLPLEDGQRLAEKCGVEVLWVDASGAEFMTPGFKHMIKKQ